LTKLPASVLELFPPLTAAAVAANAVRHREGQPARPHQQPDSRELGAPYRTADEEVAVSERDPFPVDPALVERANRTHARTQNILATHLKQHGIEPRSPVPGEPNYDLAWVRNGTTYVAEVKSLTAENEEKQLRLGLGQVLRYRHMLRARYGRAGGVIMLERKPTDENWQDLCTELGIKLLWPDVLARLDE
jgi:hypothetical protein